MATFLPTTAFLDAIGGSELVLIFVIVLILFGGEKLPGFARGLGKSIREFKKATAGVEEEIRRAIEAAPEPTPRPQPAAHTIAEHKPAPNALPEAQVAPEPHEPYAPSETPAPTPVPEAPAPSAPPSASPEI